MSEGRRVFISGVAGGVGLALARRFLAAGDRVGGCDLGPPAGALPPGLRYYSAEVRDPAPLADAVAQFARAAGGLDIAVANAGISHPKILPPDFVRGRRVIEVNVLGVLNLFAPAVEIMRAHGGGQLVALASLSALNGLPGMAFYGASKAAVLSLCESLALDLARERIQVTTIAPGFIATGLTSGNHHPMPFLLDAETAAARIHRAILRRETRVLFPWRAALLARVLQSLPRSLYRRLMRNDPFHLREETP